MISLSNSHSLTDFQRNAKGLIDALNDTKTPILLTVNGKVKAVLIDPETIEDIESRLEQARFIEAIREGLADVDTGRTKPADQVFREIRKKYGVSDRDIE